MPPSIKHAIMQPQVLHSDTKSFYESTLWRKEKEICLSRMGRNIKKHTEVYTMLYTFFILLKIHMYIFKYYFVLLGFLSIATSSL